MPVDIDTKTLRGAIVEVARRERPAVIDTLSNFKINQYINTTYPGRFNRPAAQAIKNIFTNLQEGPYPISGREKVEQFSFGYWYNYFFREVPDNQALPFILEVVKLDGSFKTELELPNAQTLFSNMLRLGFQPFTVRDSLTRQALFDDMIKDPENVVQRDLRVEVVFRGDGRSPEKIQKDSGTVPQTQIDFLRKDRNIEKDWHPFKPQLMGNQVWLRKGFNKDNCLFSAVSVTPQFLVATKFPLLDDLLTSNPGAVGSAVVKVKKIGGPPVVQAPVTSTKGLAKQFDDKTRSNQQFQQTGKTTVDRLERSLLASRTQIYVIKSGSAYNTQAYQDSKFPEYAMDRISWADHLAYISVIRIHYSKFNGNAGHLIVIDDFRWLHDENELKLILTNHGYTGLKNYLEGLVARARLRPDGKGGIPYQAGMPVSEIPVSPQFELDGEILEIESVKEKFMSAKGGISTFSKTTTPTLVKPPTPKPGKIAIPSAFTK